MPVDPFTGVDNDRRLQLGQGFAGGGKSLPTLQTKPAPPLRLPKAPLTSGPPAVDVTPPPLGGGPLRPQSPEGRGAAILRRGWPTLSTANIPMPTGPGVKKTIKLLSDPDRLFKPENKKNLDLIMRPGPKVQALIDADPHLKQNQQGLQQHILTNGPTKLPAQDIIKKLHDTVGAGKMNLADFVKTNRVQLMGLDDQGKQRFSAAADVAQHSGLQAREANYQQAGSGAPVQKIFDNNIFSNAANQAYGIVTGMVPGTIQLAEHPVGTTEKMAKATASYYSPLFHGDIGKFGQNFNQAPLTPFLDLSAGAGAVAGGLGRVGAAGDAMSALRSAATVEDLGNGAARVGGRYTIHNTKNGRFMVRDQVSNRFVGSNFPDAQTAIEHATSLGSGGISGSVLKAGARAFARPMTQGRTGGKLLDLWDKHMGHTHDAENQAIIEELQGVAENPNLKLSRRSFGEVMKAAKADISTTMQQMTHRAADILGEEPQFYNRATAHARAGAEQAGRELISGVRMGAIYLRPAYLPNNWAGNTFMSLTHQGFLAPMNLAKSVVMHNHMDSRNLAMLDKSMGQNAAAAAYEGMPRGLIASAGHPLMEGMGKLADQPFRRAAFLHEARRLGYTKLEHVDDLFNRFRAGDERAQQDVANIARRAQEEVVKFGHMNSAERAVASNLLFVWNWVKGSTRYASRFPLQHPLQTDVYAHDAPVGQQWVDKNMGGVPWFLAGSIPVGHKANGDPILINPFALNPLGTSLQVARAAQGTYKALTHTGDFNKYADSSFLDLTNPLVQEGIKAVTGQNPNVKQDLEQQIAPIRLAKDLEHPGRGSMFPMTRTEALGHYIFGSLYPREASQTAIERALERQNQGNPLKMLDMQVQQWNKATGHPLPPQFLGQLKGDVEALDEMKKFQKHYASSKGSQGFKNMPPANKAEAGIQFIEQYGHLPKDAVDSLKQAVASAPNDAVLNELSNTIWGMTGAGQIKRQWDEMIRNVKPTTKTPEKK